MEGRRIQNWWHAEFDEEQIIPAPAVGRRMFWERLFGGEFDSIFQTTDPENEPNATQED